MEEEEIERKGGGGERRTEQSTTKLGREEECRRVRAKSREQEGNQRLIKCLGHKSRGPVVVLEILGKPGRAPGRE